MSAFAKTNKVDCPEFSSIKRGTPKEPCRDSKEVAAMFGYKNAQSLVKASHQGKFPAPDLVGGITVNKLYWKLSTLEKERKRREKL